MKSNFYTLFVVVLIPILGYSQKNNLNPFLEKIGKGDLNRFYINPNQSLTSEDFIFEMKKELNLSSSHQLIEKKKRTHKGLTHRTFQQFYHDFPIYGAIYLLHEKQGTLISTNGDLITNLSQKPNIVLSKDEAIQRAIDVVNAEQYAWQEEGMQFALRKASGDHSLTWYPEAKLLWFNPNFNFQAKEYKLCYELEIYASKPLSKTKYFINAATGEIEFSINQIHHLDIEVETLYAGEQTIDVIFDGNAHQLRSFEKDCQTHILPNNSINYLDAPEVFESVDIDFDNITSPEMQAGLDVHWGMLESYDFFDGFDLNGINSSASDIVSAYVNYGDDEETKNNAFWNGAFFTFGAGGNGGQFSGPVASLDVVAHEYGHAVTQFVGQDKLVYLGESGAINESYSDIYSVAIQNQVLQNSPNLPYDIWTIGEQIAVDGALRSFSDPNSENQPDTYQQENYWFDPTDFSVDDGGVHQNSGIMNYWFYLIVNGGEGWNNAGIPDYYNVAPLDDDPQVALEMAIDLIYTTYDYLPFFPSFEDMKLSSLDAAELIFDDCEQQLTIIEAWKAVGLGEESTDCAFEVFIQNTEYQKCQGESFNFSATSPNNNFSYTWYLDGQDLGFDSYNINLSLDEVGTYELTLEVYNPILGLTDTDTEQLYVSTCDGNANGNYYFEKETGINFANGIPSIGSYPYYNDEGLILQMGEDGNPLFYTGILNNLDDGYVKLFDSNHEEVVSLAPAKTSAYEQGISIPSPTGNIYNVFVLSGHAADFSGLYRNVVYVDDQNNVSVDPNVHMQGIGGEGILQEETPGVVLTLDFIDVVPSLCSSHDFWLIAVSRRIEDNSEVLVVYQLSYDPNNPTDIGTLTYHDYFYGGLGTSKVNITPSPNGKLFYTGKLVEFDASTGDFTNVLSNIPLAKGGVFSPNSRFLYVGDNNGRLFQYDCLSDDIIGTRVLISSGGGLSYFNPFLGPGLEKVYFSYVDGNRYPQGKNRLAVINNPNIKANLNNNLEIHDVLGFTTTNILGIINFPHNIIVDVGPSATPQISYEVTDCYTYQFYANDCKPFYVWIFDDGSVAIQQNPVHTFEPGTYNVELRELTNGVYESAFIEITVGPDESTEITGADIACSDLQTFIAPFGFSNYYWEIIDGNGSISINDQQTALVQWEDDQGGIIQLSYLDNNDCEIILEKEMAPCSCGFGNPYLKGNRYVCSYFEEDYAVDYDCSNCTYDWSAINGEIVAGGGLNDMEVTVIWDVTNQDGQILLTITNLDFEDCSMDLMLPIFEEEDCPLPPCDCFIDLSNKKIIDLIPLSGIDAKRLIDDQTGIDGNPTAPLCYEPNELPNVWSHWGMYWGGPSGNIPDPMAISVLDLGQHYIIDQIQLFDGYGNGTYNGLTYKFEILKSLDGVNYTSVYSFVPTDFNAWHEVPLAFSFNTRYLKFIMGHNVAQIAEVAICGEPTYFSACQTPNLQVETEMDKAKLFWNGTTDDRYELGIKEFGVSDWSLITTDQNQWIFNNLEINKFYEFKIRKYCETMRDYSAWNQSQMIFVQNPKEEGRRRTEINAHLEVFPNPAHDFVDIEYGFPETGQSTFSLQNALGQIILEEEWMPSNLINQTRIDLRQIPTGVYWIRIKQNDISATKKIIITR